MKRYISVSQANTFPELTSDYDQPVLDFLGKHPIAIQQEVAEYLSDVTGKNVSSKVAGDALKRLITAGLVEKNGKKFYLNNADMNGV